MDFNLVVVAGSLAAPPELAESGGGLRFVRYLVTARSERPRRRVDVLPVVCWRPEALTADTELTTGRRVWIVGSVQRRFWPVAEGRRSRLEIVAHHVEPLDPPGDPAEVCH